MVEDAGHSPINTSHDFQLGIVFARLDGGDKRMDGLEQKMSDFGRELEQVNSTIIKVKDDMVHEVKLALDLQTQELKPVLTEKMVRDANALAKKQRQEEASNFWSRAFAIISICSVLAGAAFSLMTYIYKAPTIQNPLPVHNVGAHKDGGNN
jgi:hypothetical protein